MPSDTWADIRSELSSKFPDLLKSALIDFVDTARTEVILELKELAQQYDRYLDRLQGGDPNAAETIKFVQARVETLLVNYGLSLSYQARQNAIKVMHTVLDVVEKIVTILANRFLGPGITV